MPTMKKARSAVPEHCKGCKHVYTGGQKDGKYNRWCCKFSRATADAVNHCKNVKGKELA